MTQSFFLQYGYFYLLINPGTTAIIYDPMSREKIWINYDTSKNIYVFY